jgi:hypothetical protein
MAASDTPPVISELFNANMEWVRRVTRYGPEFFRESAKDQRPKVLWIGWCVPPGAQPLYELAKFMTLELHCM